MLRPAAEPGPDPADLRDEIRARTEASLYDFGWDVLDYKAMHEPLHRDQVCSFLQTWRPGKFIKVLLVPREHLKSTIATLTLPLWVWTLDPDKHDFPCGVNTRFLLAHGKLASAVDYGREIKDHIRNNEVLRWAYPEIIPPQTASHLWLQDKFNINRTRFDKTPSMVMGGVGASVVGKHFDWLIFDDLILSEDDVATPEARARTLLYFRQCMALVRRGGRVLVVGTRWHHDDYYSLLTDPEGPYRNVVDFLCLSSGFYDRDPIFPPSEMVPQCGFDMERLQQKLDAMGLRDFTAQYENNPRPDAAASFREEDIRRFRLDLDGTVPTTKALRFFTAVDPNRSVETRNDPCAIVTAAIDQDGDIWVVDITRGHPSGSQIIEWIRAHVLKWQPESVIVETNNYQLQLVHWMEEDQITNSVYYPIIEAKRGPKQRKFTRITALQPMVERGQLHVLLGTDFDQLVHELVNFGVAKNDDLPDALADIYQYGERPRKAEPAKREAPSSPFLLKSLLGEMVDLQATGRVARRGDHGPSCSRWG